MNRQKSKLFKFILFSSVFLVGCSINIGCLEQKEKYTKVVHMPLKTLSPGSDFATKTHNGSIKVFGLDVPDCNVIATIEGRAATQEEAREIVEKTKLSFEQSEEKLVLKINKPSNPGNRSVSVNLDIVLPEQVNLKLETHNGSVEIENITGDTTIITHNGKVIASNLTGTTRLETHNGRIEGSKISGDMDFKSHNGRVEGIEITGNITFETHNGHIEANYSQTAESDSDIKIVTHNGGIELTTPPNYSAKVDVSTHNGSIDTKLPVTVTGNLSKKNLTGTIGDGQGELKLETHNGSIKIK